MAKIEGCEETHKYMLLKHLDDRGVPHEHYYRLNVDVGVGEFGMNEWSRLADISTNTRRYLAASEVQSMTSDAARKMSAIARATIRWNRGMTNSDSHRMSWEQDSSNTEYAQAAPPTVPGAIELPAEDVPAHRPNSQLLSPTYHVHQTADNDDKYLVQPDDPYLYENRPMSQGSYGAVSPYGHSPRSSAEHGRPYGPDLGGYGQDLGGGAPLQAPPRPPKTPLQAFAPGRVAPHVPPREGAGTVLPYPDTDGPPPIVNLSRKPELR